MHCTTSQLEDFVLGPFGLTVGFGFRISDFGFTDIGKGYAERNGLSSSQGELLLVNPLDDRRGHSMRRSLSQKRRNLIHDPRYNHPLALHQTAIGFFGDRSGLHHQPGPFPHAGAVEELGARHPWAQGRNPNTSARQFVGQSIRERVNERFCRIVNAD